jgi:heptosyltransferase I
MNLVCSSTRPWDGSAEQQLLLRLSRRGHRVLYVQHISPDGRGRRAVAGESSVRTGVERLGAGALFGYRYSPPPRLPAALRGWHVRRTLRNLVRELYLPEPAVLDTCDVPASAWLGARPLGRVLFPLTQAALDHPAARAPAELGLAPTREALDALRRVHADVRLFERGADRDRFAPWRVERTPPDARLAGLAGPRLGYVGPAAGADWQTVAAIARARPEWNIVLATAPVAAGLPAELADLGNVLAAGVSRPEAVLALLAGLDALIWPRGTAGDWPGEPMPGLLDCLATGLPVACASAAPPPCTGAATAATPEEWLLTLEAALADPSAGRAERLACAQQNDWESRTDELERHLHDMAAAHRSAAGVRTVHGAAVARIPGVPHQFDDYGMGVAGPALGTWQGRLPFEAARAAGWTWYALRLVGRALTGRWPIRIRRILVVRNKTFLGDTIAMMPALEALREHYPHAHIVLGVQQGAAIIPLVHELELVDEVVLLEWEKATSRRAQLLEAWRSFRRGYDLVVSGVAYFLAQEAFYTGAPYRVGLYSGEPMQRLNNRVVPLDRTRHEVENNLDLIEVMTGRTETPRRTPRIGVDAATAAAAAEALWDELGIPRGAWVVTLHPGSKKPSRRWPTERFAALIARLLSEHPQLRAVVTGVPGEDHLAEEIVALVPEPLRGRAINAVGRTSMTSLIGLLDASRLVVSNDTGVMHLARARGAALLAVLGPENDRRWGPVPWGQAPAVALRHVVPCAPCARTNCGACYCLKSLSVDQAFMEADRLLRRDTSGDAAAGGVQRRLRHHTWHDLVEAGFEIPLVSVVLLDAGAATLRALERQDYPRIEIISLAGERIDVLVSRTGGVRSIDAGAAASARAWGHVLAAASGEIIAPLPEGADWPAEKISTDVAMLIRNPEAGCNVAADADNGRLLGAVAARRDALVHAIEELRGQDAALEAPFARLVRRTAPASVRMDLPVLRTAVAPADSLLTAVR